VFVFASYHLRRIRLAAEGRRYDNPASLGFIGGLSFLRSAR